MNRKKMGAGKETSSDALNRDIELQSPSEINGKRKRKKEKKKKKFFFFFK